MDTSSTKPLFTEQLYSYVGDIRTSGFPNKTDTLPMLNCMGSTNEIRIPKPEILARQVKTLSIYETIVDRIIQKQITGLIVDNTSRITMAEALEFSGIDTLEKAESLNIKVIPPGPILHTWYAKYKTGLFDGINNPPHVKSLDYVTRVSEQADRLMDWGIPVILVYLERDMHSAELIKMQKLFSEHENILVMSLESDLTSLKHIDYYKRHDAIQLLDDPRFSLCREYPEVLKVAQEKAKSVGKHLLLQNLIALGGHSIIYSDIDNTFLRKPMFQLAVHGARNVCPFRKEFSLQDDKICKKYQYNSNLLSECPEGKH